MHIIFNLEPCYMIGLFSLWGSKNSLFPTKIGYDILRDLILVCFLALQTTIDPIKRSGGSFIVPLLHLICKNDCIVYIFQSKEGALIHRNHINLSQKCMCGGGGAHHQSYLVHWVFETFYTFILTSPMAKYQSDVKISTWNENFNLP